MRITGFQFGNCTVIRIIDYRVGKSQASILEVGSSLPGDVMATDRSLATLLRALQIPSSDQDASR